MSMCVYWVMFLGCTFIVFVQHAWVCDWNMHVWFICIFVLSPYTWIVYCTCWVHCNIMFILCTWVWMHGDVYMDTFACVCPCVYQLLLNELTSINWMCVCITRCITSCISVTADPKHTRYPPTCCCLIVSSVHCGVWCLGFGPCVWAPAWLTPRTPTV